MIDATRMGGTGWSRLEGMASTTREDFDKQREAMMAEAEIIAAPFLTEAGKRCLELLVAKTFDRPLIRLPVEAASMEHQALYAAQRQGQNDIVGMIRAALARVGSGQAEMTNADHELAAPAAEPGRRKRRK